MYPGPKLLREVGRVAIAAARLDVAMGQLWGQLEPDQDPVKARKASARMQRQEVERAAGRRLEEGPLLDQVRHTAKTVEKAQDRRNVVIHQDWLIRGSEMAPSVPEPVGDSAEEWAAYLDECEREAKESASWRQLPARSLTSGPAQTFDEIRAVERELAALRWDVISLIGKVARARLLGEPAGYIGGTRQVNDPGPSAPPAPQ